MDPSIQLPSLDKSPQDNSVVQVRGSGWVRIVRGQSTEEVRNMSTKVSSSEGQGSSWPCLRTASSTWREISHQDSGVLGEEDLEHLLKDEEGWGKWSPGVVGCVLQTLTTLFDWKALSNHLCLSHHPQCKFWCKTQMNSAEGGKTEVLSCHNCPELCSLRSLLASHWLPPRRKLH